MSDNVVQQISGSESSQPSAVTQGNAVVTDSTSQAGAATSNPDQVKMSDTISSMNELKDKAPEVYNKMMQGIAMNICAEMKRHQEHLKQAIRGSYT